MTQTEALELLRLRAQIREDALRLRELAASVLWKMRRKAAVEPGLVTESRIIFSNFI